MSNTGSAFSAHDRWEMSAACRGMDTSAFYPADKERGVARRVREAKAKAICRQCPVITQCLQWAIATNEPWGLWGGQSRDERVQSVIGLTA
jgi:WhiB family transcriptional regulator, redox-sensing transcriptional regulator